MEVVRLTEQQRDQYSQFVAAHPSGSFLQSWSWGNFQTEQGKTVYRYGVFDDSKNLIGSVQLLQTKIPRLPGDYVYAPYGPLVNLEFNLKEVSDALIAKVKNDFAKSWFIRIEPKDELPIDGKPSVHIQPGSTLITDLSVPTEELLSGMHQKTRYNIKVADKHGIKVSHDSWSKSDSLQKQAINLLVSTSKRQGYKSHNAAYYESLLDYFDGNTGSDCEASLYIATTNSRGDGSAADENQRTIASAIMIDHGNTRTYLFGGSDNEFRNLMAPYALHWNAISDAKQIGKQLYDWWGTETATGSTPGFVQFKLRWGGTQKFYAGARDIVLNSMWYRAYNTLRKVNRLF